MVRLKADVALNRASVLLSFQFQYGAIKSSAAGSVVDINTNFNSSMVRLKEAFFNALTFNLNISIPVWCD